MSANYIGWLAVGLSILAFKLAYIKKRCQPTGFHLSVTKE